MQDFTKLKNFQLNSNTESGKQTFAENANKALDGAVAYRHQMNLQSVGIFQRFYFKRQNGSVYVHTHGTDSGKRP